MKRNTILLYLLTVLGTLFFLSIDSIHKVYPYDDVYSMNMITYSFVDIAQITADDVHPPLYYWGLKAYSIVLGDSMLALRFFSTIGFLATMLLGVFSIRRMFGDRTVIFFIALLCLFPVSQYIATEIRMYSWAMFFVTACAVFSYDVYRRGSILDWIKFFTAGICAAYTHNFALIAVFWIYAILFLALVISKKKYFTLIICGILFSLFYLPWLLQLIWQAQVISKGYWIEPIRLNDMLLHIYYLYSPKEVWRPFIHFSKPQMMVGIIITMAIQLGITLYVLYKGFKQKEKYVIHILLLFLLFILPTLTGLVYSLLVTPVLSARYMTCAFGLFVLSMAITLGKAWELKKLKPLVGLFLLLLVFNCCIRFYSGTAYFNQMEQEYIQYRNFTNPSNQKEEWVVANFYSYHLIPQFQKIAPDNKYIVIVPNGAKDTFVPTRLTIVEYGDAIETDEFILIDEAKVKFKPQFKEFYQYLSKFYHTKDSLYIGNIKLYRLKEIKQDTNTTKPD